MRQPHEKKHMIDFLFPLALLFVFAACSFSVILLASSIYSQSTADAQENYETRTVLSYLSEKIHQNDENGNVHCGTYEGRDALIIQQTYGENLFYTYIYEDEGVLKELFLQENATAPASSGKEIMAVENFQLEETEEGLIRLACTSGNKDVHTYVTLRSDSRRTS